MSTTDPAAATGHDSESTPEQSSAAAPAASDEPIATAREREVEIQRTVRIGRVLAMGIVVGVVVAALGALSFPVAEEDHYTMPQIVGFTILIGGAVGLALGALVSLLLTLVARRKHGSGVAVQTDVR